MHAKDQYSTVSDQTQ